MPTTIVNIDIPAFDKWWASYWKPNSQPAALNEAMKELAWQGWVARAERDALTYPQLDV
jgi:hypothetical protein